MLPVHQGLSIKNTQGRAAIFAILIDCELDKCYVPVKVGGNNGGEGGLKKLTFSIFLGQRGQQLDGSWRHCLRELLRSRNRGQEMLRHLRGRSRTLQVMNLPVNELFH